MENTLNGDDVVNVAEVILKNVFCSQEFYLVFEKLEVCIYLIELQVKCREVNIFTRAIYSNWFKTF